MLRFAEHQTRTYHRQTAPAPSFLALKTILFAAVRNTNTLKVKPDPQLNSPRIAIHAVPDAPEDCIGGRRSSKTWRLRPDAGCGRNRELERRRVGQVVYVGPEFKIAMLTEKKPLPYAQIHVEKLRTCEEVSPRISQLSGRGRGEPSILFS